MIRSLALGLLSLAATAGHATRYHVMINATGTATGLTWENAFTNLQEALSIVIPGDEIWVAAGQYKPTSGTSRTISFALRNGVNLFGGFAGDEMTISERDIASNPTVLNGDIGEPGSSSDNSHRVVTAININTVIILDGFRIMNGYSASGTGYNGGGLNVQNALNGNLIIRNTTFVNNYSGDYGGGVYLAAAHVTIEDCDFINNSAGTGGDGGAIYNGNNNGGYSHLEIRDSRFKNNTARLGACLYGGLDFDPLIIDRCLFTGNTSELSIIDLDGFTSASITNSLIAGNVVDDSFAQVFRIQTSAQDEVMTMSNCTFVQNYNLDNGPQRTVFFVYGTHHRIVNSIVHGNTAYNGRQVSAGMGITNSIVEGGHVNGTDITDLAPLFDYPNTGGPASFDATLFDYTLQPTSPGINVGLNDAVVAPYDLDLSQFPRIQGGIVDLGCYETDQTVAIAEAPAVALWYYDVFNRELRMAGSSDLGNTVAQVHDLQGKLIATLTVRGRRHRIDLPAGAYVLSNSERGTLRFVVP